MDSADRHLHGIARFFGGHRCRLDECARKTTHLAADRQIGKSSNEAQTACLAAKFSRRQLVLRCRRNPNGQLAALASPPFTSRQPPSPTGNISSVVPVGRNYICIEIDGWPGHTGPLSTGKSVNELVKTGNPRDPLPLTDGERLSLLLASKQAPTLTASFRSLIV